MFRPIVPLIAPTLPSIAYAAKEKKGKKGDATFLLGRYDPKKGDATFLLGRYDPGSSWHAAIIACRDE